MRTRKRERAKSRAAPTLSPVNLAVPNAPRTGSALEPLLEPARSKFKVDPDAPTMVIGLPVRRTSPVEFWISMLQALMPLNVRVSYLYQKGADVAEWATTDDYRLAKTAELAQRGDPTIQLCPMCRGAGEVKRVGTGKLPAAARNAIIQRALAAGIEYLLFLDDDVLFPELAFYRLWVAMAKHPEAACITGVYTSKQEPTEPLLYLTERDGAYWDWALGDLVPIHSAGAGIMLVRMRYVAHLAPPWFNDVVTNADSADDSLIHRNTWGHDRFFHMRLRDEAHGVVYADTGLLCAHWDTDLQKNFILPPDAPCFQRAPAGEAFVPYLDERGVVQWRRLVTISTPRDGQFKGWLDSLGRSPTGPVLQLVNEEAPG